MTTTQKTRNLLVALWTHSLEYCESTEKNKAHTTAGLVLQFFATKVLGLAEDQFDIRSNMGGIAVSGEVTLHTSPFEGCENGIYIQISRSCMSELGEVMFRTCKSQRDYTGGGNNFGRVKGLFGTQEAEAEFATKVRALVEGTVGSQFRAV